MVAETNAAQTAGELIYASDAVPPGMRVAEVADSIFTARRLEAVAVVEGERVCGLVTRTKVLSTLFRRFGFELFGRDPIIALAERAPLTVSETELIDSVLEQAMRRAPADIYDEVVVVGADGCYRGLLSVRGMVVAQGDALSRSLIQREVAVAKAREMQKVSDIKSQFIAHVTHELRSPANVVLGVAELIREQVGRGCYEEIGNNLSLLQAGATSMRSVITNILDLSKIEAGKMEVINEPCALAPLLEEVADMTRVLLASQPVAVEVRFDPATPPLLSDSVKLRQILINFASNAAKFTPQGKIVLCAEACPRGVRLSVADSGIGIRPENLEKLFVAFSQLEDAHTKRYEGTGLGLTITRQLAELLGGTVTVASTFGSGSTFSLELPLHPPAHKETTA